MPSRRSQFVRANQAMHGIATMCRVLGVSPSGYYAWRTRPPSAAGARGCGTEHADRRRFIDRSRATYGAPRIHAELAEQGIRVGRKRVARLMRGGRALWA